MKEVKVEVLGPEPPCMRCQAAKKIVEKVAEKLKQTEISVKVEKANVMSKDIVSKYGVLVSPAIAINGVVRFMGRVPSEAEVEKTIREAVKKEA
ncbi:MAG: thioredoxin family protein [Candidatus Bathyarchaeota archaeon]|jgi:glutaredoxin|nr:thioredoxin family protein [Candidatus Bathyarchaeota archaeon]